MLNGIFMALGGCVFAVYNLAYNYPVLLALIIIGYFLKVHYDIMAKIKFEKRLRLCLCYDVAFKRFKFHPDALHKDTPFPEKLGYPKMITQYQNEEGD